MTDRIQKPIKKRDSKKKADKSSLLFLYNDEIHSFDYVIESLIDICGHSFVQAEQCTTIAHYKGVCDIKKGKRKILKYMQMELIQKGLKADVK